MPVQVARLWGWIKIGECMYQTILVPTDFSPAAGQAWDQAKSLAKQFGSKLVVLYVAQPVESHYGIMALMPGLRELEEKQDVESRLKLKELVSAAEADGLSADCAVVSGRPWECVVQEAKNQNADLIVVGTHGQSGFVRDTIGSTAERVVRHSPCPVLVVRSR